jgi:hypothetical protein
MLGNKDFCIYFWWELMLLLTRLTLLLPTTPLSTSKDDQCLVPKISTVILVTASVRFEGASVLESLYGFWTHLSILKCPFLQSFLNFWFIFWVITWLNWCAYTLKPFWNDFYAYMLCK